MQLIGELQDRQLIDVYYQGSWRRAEVRAGDFPIAEFWGNWVVYGHLRYGRIMVPLTGEHAVPWRVPKL